MHAICWNPESEIEVITIPRSCLSNWSCRKRESALGPVWCSRSSSSSASEVSNLSKCKYHNFRQPIWPRRRRRRAWAGHKWRPRLQFRPQFAEFRRPGHRYEGRINKIVSSRHREGCQPLSKRFWRTQDPRTKNRGPRTEKHEPRTERTGDNSQSRAPAFTTCSNIKLIYLL